MGGRKGDGSRGEGRLQVRGWWGRSGHRGGLLDSLVFHGAPSGLGAEGRWLSTVSKGDPLEGRAEVGNLR